MRPLYQQKRHERLKLTHAFAQRNNWSRYLSAIYAKSLSITWEATSPFCAHVSRRGYARGAREKSPLKIKSASLDPQEIGWRRVGGSGKMACVAYPGEDLARPVSAAEWHYNASPSVCAQCGQSAGVGFPMRAESLKRFCDPGPSGVGGGLHGECRGAN